jgi:uncharacterized membrane protein required for colicin V production
LSGIIRNIFSIMGLIVAVILGLYGQDISYFLNENFPNIGLTTSITIVTFMSIALFISIPIVYLVSKKVKKVTTIVYLVASGLLGIPISIWSFFVWAMWMG